MQRKLYPTITITHLQAINFGFNEKEAKKYVLATSDSENAVLGYDAGNNWVEITTCDPDSAEAIRAVKELAKLEEPRTPFKPNLGGALSDDDWKILYANGIKLGKPFMIPSMFWGVAYMMKEVNGEFIIVDSSSDEEVIDGEILNEFTEALDIFSEDITRENIKDKFREAYEEFHLEFDEEPDTEALSNLDIHPDFWKIWELKKPKK